jgi:hypothetical protein
MKKFIAIVAFLVGAIVSAQEVVIDSVQVYNTMENGGNLIGTQIGIEGFEENMTKVSDKLGVDVFIIKVFGKPGPPVTMVIRRKREDQPKKIIKRELLKS